jgi:hypothetical protein
MRRLLACGILMTASVHGAVIYTDVEDIPLFRGDPRALDLNGDGIDDVIFETGRSFVAHSTSTSSIAGIPTTPPNQNHFAAPLAGGSIIGSSIDGFEWNEGYSGLISVANVGMDTVVLGLWGGIEAYLGVQFEIEGETHYGWILVDTPFLVGGGVIKAFAYESEAGVPIIAGVVPEPSAAALAALGILAGAVSRRRRPDDRAA